MLVWSFCSFAFFLIPFFITNMKIGDMYESLLSSEVAEFVACVFVVFVTRFCTLINAFSCFCALISIGSVLMLFVKKDENAGLFTSILIFIVNFGIVCAYDIAYLINPTLFPTIMLATVYGCCNALGRFVTISAPVIGKWPEPLPLLILISFSTLCLFGSRFLISRN